MVRQRCHVAAWFDRRVRIQKLYPGNVEHSPLAYRSFRQGEIALAITDNHTITIDAVARRRGSARRSNLAILERIGFPDFQEFSYLGIGGLGQQEHFFSLNLWKSLRIFKFDNKNSSLYPYNSPCVQP